MKQHVFLKHVFLKHVFLKHGFFVVVKLDFPGGREAWSKNHGNSRGWGGGGGLTITPWNGNSKGVGSIKLKNPLWEGYGYFLEPHISCSCLFSPNTNSWQHSICNSHL